jgi:hypothetical protein
MVMELQHGIACWMRVLGFSQNLAECLCMVLQSEAPIQGARMVVWSMHVGVARPTAVALVVSSDDTELSIHVRIDRVFLDVGSALQATAASSSLISEL